MWICISSRCETLKMKEQQALSPCRVCGGREFTHHDVLWSELICEWQLSDDEVQYINTQQGTCCTQCGSNVRSIALAGGILRHARSLSTLDEWVKGEEAKICEILEINEAGSLTSVLRKMARHQLVRYPECDMMVLPFKDQSFDLIVHSDTLEHVPNPFQGLKECRRVLRPGGACIFTVPLIIGRLTRSRQDLPISVHGNLGCADTSYVVHTEFGADIWCHLLDIGFDDCRIVPYQYPAGIALVAGIS
jgi:SAM-dependent methyltransferase